MYRTILTSLLNGLLAMYAVAAGSQLWKAPLSRILWPPMLQAVPGLIYLPWALEEFLLVGSFLVAATTTSFLIRWRRTLASQRRTTDALAGVIWAYAIAAVVGALVLGGLTLVASLDPFDPLGILYATLALPLGAATGVFMALLWFPVTLIGGAVAGLLTFGLVPRSSSRSP
jgi:hypothetical protein